MRIERIGLATLYLGDCREIAPGLGAVDHIITDPPYSERTHVRHDGAPGDDGSKRQSLGYCSLSPDDCRSYSALFHTVTPGWVVWMTDHILAPAITEAMDRHGRCTFAPLPFYQAGRSVRLPGDGPCSWTDWIVVARTAALKKWGTLPGGYIAGQGWNDKARMGGKPTMLMRLLVNDYSRHGETVCDPFMGAGTTGVAATTMGRRFVGVEIDPEAFSVSCRRIEQAQRQADLFVTPPKRMPVDPYPVLAMGDF